MREYFRESKTPFHVYNRGTEKRIIFTDYAEYCRFLFLMWACRIGRPESSNRKDIIKAAEAILGGVEPDPDLYVKEGDGPLVNFVAWNLEPNHFHFLLTSSVDGGIAKYMSKLSNAYTKYFNAKYRRSGHLFEGKFKSAHVDTDEYLDYLSAYIHLNPRELRGFSGLEVNYTWSSFQDFVHENRLGGFLKPGIILEKFYKGSEYEKFVTELPIKTTRDNLDGDLLID